MAFLFDENVERALIEALFRYYPRGDFVRVQDVGLSGRDGLLDPEILAWASTQNRVVVTHDQNTMVGYFYERQESGLLPPPVIIVNQKAPTNVILEDQRLLVETSANDWDGPIDAVQDLFREIGDRV